MDKSALYVVYGSDEREMTRQLLAQYDLVSLIGERSRSIVLKPNLVVTKTPASGAVTHTSIVETTIQELQKLGYHNITIAEGSGIGGSTTKSFALNGYHQLRDSYGVTLVDTQRENYVKVTQGGIPLELSKTVAECDFLINFPVLKGHCQTNLTCALKNMKGCISDRSKRYFHTIGLHEPIAVLNQVRSADLIIVDSINGDLDFEEGGTPVYTGRMLSALDPVLIDAYSAQLLGYALHEIPYIEMAEQLNVGSARLESANIIELNQDMVPQELKPTGRARRLAESVDQRSACSSCFGNLIHALARLEEKHSYRRPFPSPLCIGQDFKGLTFDGVGIGICTRGATTFVTGCPPTTFDIVTFLESLT